MGCGAEADDKEADVIQEPKPIEQQKQQIVQPPPPPPPKQKIEEASKPKEQKPKTEEKSKPQEETVKQKQAEGKSKQTATKSKPEEPNSKPKEQSKQKEEQKPVKKEVVKEQTPQKQEPPPIQQPEPQIEQHQPQLTEEELYYQQQEIMAIRAETMKMKPRAFNALLKQYYVKIQDYNIDKHLDIERYFTRTGALKRVQKILALNNQQDIYDWERFNLFNLMRLGKFDFRDGYTMDLVNETKACIQNQYALEMFNQMEQKYFAQDGGKMNYGQIRMSLQGFLEADDLEATMSLLVQRTLEFQDFAYLCNFIQWLCREYMEPQDMY